MSLLVDWIQPGKEFLSLRLSQQKPPTLKSKENKDWKKEKEKQN